MTGNRFTLEPAQKEDEGGRSRRRNIPSELALNSDIRDNDFVPEGIYFTVHGHRGHRARVHHPTFTPLQFNALVGIQLYHS